MHEKVIKNQIYRKWSLISTRGIHFSRQTYPGRQYYHSKEFLPNITSSFSVKSFCPILLVSAYVKGHSPSFLYLMKDCSEMSPEPSVLHSEEPQISQFLIIG